MNRESQSINEQGWFTRSIAVQQELLAKTEQIRNGTQTVQKAHIQDLMSAAIQRAETAEAKAAQLKTEKQVLYRKLASTNAELQSCYQELKQTNQELAQALNCDQITCQEAIAVAQEILAEGDSVKDALGKLLQSIYGREVNPHELQQPQTSLAVTPQSASRAKFRALSARVSTNQQECKTAIERSLKLIAQSQHLLAQCRKSRVSRLKSGEMKPINNLDIN